MATLTVHHADDLNVVAEITAIATGQEGTSIDATQTGVTTVEFPSEANARTVAAVLAQAAAVTGISIEAGP
jgi:hypothetical protein